MLVAMILGLLAITAGAVDPLLFDTSDTGPAPADVPAIKPWKIVPLDPDYGGQWVVAADLDADGEVKFVACENHNVGDVHYTSAAVAHHLDGTVLWRWGDPNLGRKEWHHDVACQIYDWDGDGLDEIVNAHSGAIYNNKGRRIATLIAPAAAEGSERSLLVGDFTGDGVPDVALVTTTALYIFKNQNGVRPAHPAGLGTEFNFTLY